MTLFKTFAVIALAAAALLAAGCGDDDNGSDNAEGTTPAAVQTTPAETTTTEAPASGDTVQVAMKDIQFSPAEQTVKVGTKVVWTNEDTVDHNVVAIDGEDFESDTFGEGGTFDYTPEKAGKIEYVCTLHPGMDGELTVTN